MRHFRLFLPLAALLLIAAGRAASLTIQTPAGLKVASAVATSRDPKAAIRGGVGETGLLFTNLVPDVSYDIRLELADGGAIQGVNLGWYQTPAAKSDAGELTEDDRAAIKAIVDIPSFYNKSDILAVRGDHSRATALVQLVRDKDFYNGKGEIVWRVELWYFEEAFGGWEKVAQQNRILQRERFKTREEFEAARAKLRWAPELGGIIGSAGQEPKVVKLDPIR